MNTKHKEIVIPTRLRKGISTRSQQPDIALDQNEFQMPNAVRNKRKVIDVVSPTVNKNEKIKRSALGNLTNDTAAGIKHLQPIKVPLGPHNQQNIPKNVNVVTKPITRAAAARQKKAESGPIPSVNQNAEAGATITKPKDPMNVSKAPSRRISNEFDKSGDSLYMSALEFSDQSSRLSLNSTVQEDLAAKRRSYSNIVKSISEDDESSVFSESSTFNTERWTTAVKLGKDPVPDGVIDFDKETLHDCLQIGEYAEDIFDYLKSKEKEFPVTDYVDLQPHISRYMRSLLVDWMVEVQESFELNHETLYLAVKLVDIFLGKHRLSKEKLQLLGAAALFIACKFDERIPPFIDDFLYICDGAYLRDELISMEKTLFKTVDFNLGIPLSYRFLRRYARCAKIPLPSLTLARYILEYGLMDYETITLSDSKLGSAALYIALKMLKPADDAVWTKTLQYYSGYTLEEFHKEVLILNENLNRKQKEALNTIRKKYSHKIFYEVALKPHLSNDILFRSTGVNWK